uniref:TIAM Rac1 associated GEF 1 n=1 Tax=Denticeps clupeoides TaxID=299321 RepID=A0AAY4DD54_9TELE
MGNAVSQNGDQVFYGAEQGHLSRKQTSRSLRLSNKQSRRPRHASTSGKVEHRNSETSTRSSSTPSIPQSLAENGLEPYTETDALAEFEGPVWADRVALNLRPLSFHDRMAEASTTPASEDSIEGDTVVQDEQDEDSLFPDEDTYLQRTADGPRESGSFKKKRSKSADMWREDSLEFSLSDISHLTSTEEIIDGAEDEERVFLHREPQPGERANSLDELCTQKNPVLRGQRSRYKYSHGEAQSPGSETLDQMLSPAEDDGNGYGAYTLPCRRSHCLSEGLPSHQAALCNRMQGRRAQTSHDITAGEGSEYGDSGIDGVAAEVDLHSRRCKTMSASFSVYSAASSSMFAGSDSGSSSGGGGGGSQAPGDQSLQGIYENFRQELDVSSRQTREHLEEADSATSDERSSGTLSSIYQSDAALLNAAQGTVRKAGLLAVKNFLVHKKNKKVEPAARRKWKRYWVSLKGCTLFFYETDGRSGIDHNSIPKHAVWAENSIVQAVPEHPKKDFVFCLSNALGDAFLFQTSGQTELENWITAIHSACAAAVARQHHREDTLRLLRSEIKKLEQKIDMDEKMKKMGDMQLSAVTDSKKRKAILEQIFLWEQNLERFHMDLFRFRCYLSSLQGGELPNPKRLLAVASRPTKLAMGRLGIFSVSSFHALVAARTEGGVRRRTQALSRSSSKRKSRFSSLWGLDTTSKKKTKGRPTINQVFVDGVTPVERSLERMCEDTNEADGSGKGLPQHNVDSEVWVPDYLTPSWVSLPSDRPVLAIIQPGETALDALESVCKTHGLDLSWHYLRLKFLVENQVQLYVPRPEEFVYDLVSLLAEFACKQGWTSSIRQSKHGFSVIVEEEDRKIYLSITDVKEGGLACAKGLKAGDEIVELNSKPGSELETSDMQAAFSLPSLTLTVSSLPAVDPRHLCQLPPRRSDADDHLCTDIFSQNQGKSTEQVTAFCRSLHDMNPAEGPPPISPLPPPTTPRQLSDADRLRKVIDELVETERTYVKDLNILIDRYLTPLQKESFLTQDELDVLFGNLPEMVEFQVEFLKTLEDGTRLVQDLEKLEKVDQFKKVLFSLGGSFLYYADRFKIYSAFCASHTKVPKVLTKAKTDPEFKAFLDQRNPKQQHSSTLESYLIKPIQRVLKYPLLLRELHSLTDPDSEEHYHLDVAMKAMNKVASHINEMQKIHEEYGAVFDHLINEQSGERKEVADLSMGDLLLHTTVSWFNPPTYLAKGKKEPGLAVFVFRTALVFVYKDSSKQKKKIGTSHRTSVFDERDPFRFRYMISTDALQVRTLLQVNFGAHPLCISALCFSSSPDTKKDFLRTLHSILRDKQRRQLMKTESLPLNQQYIPFGGKRLCALKGSRPAMNRTVSAPSRSLGRRKLVRNRITIDTDIIFNYTSEDAPILIPSPTQELEKPPQKPQPTIVDTNRWVDEQFDFGTFNNQVKETDILSDEDEYCESVRSSSTEPALEEPVLALTLDGPKDHREPPKDPVSSKNAEKSHAPLKLSALRKQCAVENSTDGEREVIWVRREDFGGGCSSDIF